MSRSHLDRDLEAMNRDLLRLAGLVADAVAGAAQALLEGDGEAARRLPAGDDEIDRLENRVSEDCLRVLALHQPVAGDLRRVVAVTQIAADLERVGDLAELIGAEAARCRPARPAVPAGLDRMAALAADMLKSAVDAYVHNDCELAREVCRRDGDVDALAHRILGELVAEMRRGPDFVGPGLALWTAANHLERVADHATNVAEDVIYLVEGAVARHHPEAVGRPAARAGT